MSFEIDVDKFVNKSINVMELVIRKTAIDLLNNVITPTPIDTGRARSNWFLQLDTPKIEILEQGAYDATGGETLSNAQGELGKLNVDTNTIYITNNLPYINRLEYDGYSNQAPNGWVRQAVINFNKEVERVARANQI